MLVIIVILPGAKKPRAPRKQSKEPKERKKKEKKPKPPKPDKSDPNRRLKPNEKVIVWDKEPLTESRSVIA